VLLTGRTEFAGPDRRHGADNYLTKPFNAHELRVPIRAGRRILDFQDALRLQGTHDGLTGFLNRNSVLEKLEEEPARGQRESRPVSRLMVDLDRFKSVPDTYGHLAGDAVLREAAVRLKSAARRYHSTPLRWRGIPVGARKAATASRCRRSVVAGGRRASLRCGQTRNPGWRAVPAAPRHRIVYSNAQMQTFPFPLGVDRGILGRFSLSYAFL